MNEHEVVTNEFVMEETILLLGRGKEELDRQMKYLKEKLGEENISWIDRDFVKNIGGFDEEFWQFVTVRVTLEQLNELKFNLGLEHVWA